MSRSRSPTTAERRAAALAARWRSPRRRRRAALPWGEPFRRRRGGALPGHRRRPRRGGRSPTSTSPSRPRARGSTSRSLARVPAADRDPRRAQQRARRVRARLGLAARLPALRAGRLDPGARRRRRGPPGARAHRRLRPPEQGSPVSAALTVADGRASCAPCAPSWRRSRATTSAASTTRPGGPTRSTAATAPPAPSAAWWYFALGRVYRFRDGRLAEVERFAPVRRIGAGAEAAPVSHPLVDAAGAAEGAPAARILELVGAELAATEEVLRSRLASDVPFIQKAGEYLFHGGGKRMRPALLLLCSRLLGRDSRRGRHLRRGGRDDPHRDPGPRRHHRPRGAAPRPAHAALGLGHQPDRAGRRLALRHRHAHGDRARQPARHRPDVRRHAAHDRGRAAGARAARRHRPRRRGVLRHHRPQDRAAVRRRLLGAGGDAPGAARGLRAARALRPRARAPASSWSTTCSTSPPARTSSASPCSPTSRRAS